jgi:UDP:flavonoid glycosyltransferase YjiC (YdhE family)
MMWQPFRIADKAARKKVLGLPPAPIMGPFKTKPLQMTPILYGYSPSVIPQPKDWEERNRVTGYWFVDEDHDWEPPQALEAFLADGPPPVYVGFGSMTSRNPEKTADIVLKALKKTGQRAVIFSGWGGLRKDDVPPSVFMTEDVPHAWLFPRMAAIVHHGGAGTTASGLRSGVPSILVPFFGDQPFWGQRVADLGVGPQPIPYKKLSVDGLAEAIKIAVENSEMRDLAASLGSKIQAEDGVTCAVEHIQRSLT